MIKTGILLATMGGLSGWAAVHASVDAPLKPQQEVLLSADAWGCQNRASLDGALGAEHAGQKQAVQQFFSDKRCATVPADQHYRVVSVTHHDVQFVNADTADTQTLWVDARFVRRE